MKVSFDVNMTDEAMTSFMYYHTYSHFTGILGIILGIVAVGLAFFTYGNANPVFSLMYLVFAFLFLLWTPFTLRSKAKQQRKNTPMFNKAITYTLDEEGITTTQDDIKSQIKWEELLKVVSTKKIMIFYVTRVRAFIAPRECIGEQYEKTLEIIREHLDPKKIKVKG